MARRSLLAASALAFTALAAFSCSASKQSSVSSVSGAAGGNAGSGGAGTSTSSSAGVGGFMASSSASSAAGGGCVGTASKANPVPLDIFVMLDQSGSMSQNAGNNLSRWQNVETALTSFMKQPNVAGIGMGIQYFGLPLPSVNGCTTHPCTSDADCTNGCTVCNPGGVCHGPYNPDVDSCDRGEYAWAEVPIQPLPGVATAILGSFAMHAPGTNTPTYPALGGAIDYAKAWAIAHPSHITVVAFATDGDPSECDLDLNHIDALAAAGFAGTPSIQTYVIGVGPSVQALDGIAAAGGTTAAFHVDMSPMATQAFVQAMNTIRGAAIKCTNLIPPPPMGKMEDFSLVNVEYKPGNGKPNVTIPKVATKADCPANGDGWYYDNNASPTEIIMCSSTCGVISMDSTGEVDIVLGCKTIMN